MPRARSVLGTIQAAILRGYRQETSALRETVRTSAAQQHQMGATFIVIGFLMCYKGSFLYHFVLERNAIKEDMFRWKERRAHHMQPRLQFRKCVVGSRRLVLWREEEQEDASVQ